MDINLPHGIPRKRSGYSIDEILMEYEVPKEQAELLEFLKGIYGLEVISIMSVSENEMCADTAHKTVMKLYTFNGLGKISISWEFNCLLLPKRKEQK